MFGVRTGPLLERYRHSAELYLCGALDLKPFSEVEVSLLFRAVEMVKKNYAFHDAIYLARSVGVMKQNSSKLRMMREIRGEERGEELMTFSPSGPKIQNPKIKITWPGVWGNEAKFIDTAQDEGDEK